MVTRFEILRRDSWRVVTHVDPGRTGTFSNDLEDGTHELYAYECARDDSYTSIHKLLPGVEIAIGPYRIINERIINKRDFSLEGVLRSGDKPFEMSVKTDVDPEISEIRLTHI